MTPDPYDLFYNNLSTFYHIRINKKIEFEIITKEILKKVKDFSSNLNQAI
jgi:hypothetical protein